MGNTDARRKYLENNILANANLVRERIKRQQVKHARKGILEARELAALSQDSKPIRHFMARHQSVRQAVTTLWALGYWTDQIAQFIGCGITEAVVLQAIRGHLSQKHSEVMQALSGQLHHSQTH